MSDYLNHACSQFRAWCKNISCIKFHALQQYRHYHKDSECMILSFNQPVESGTWVSTFPSKKLLLINILALVWTLLCVSSASWSTWPLGTTVVKIRHENQQIFLFVWEHIFLIYILGMYILNDLYYSFCLYN